MHRWLQPVEERGKVKGPEAGHARYARARESERSKTEYRGGYMRMAKEGAKKGYSSCASSSNCSNLAICLRSVVGQDKLYRA